MATYLGKTGFSRLDELLGVYEFVLTLEPDEVEGVVQLSRVFNRNRLVGLLEHCRKHGPGHSQKKIALALLLRTIEERRAE